MRKRTTIVGASSAFIVFVFFYAPHRRVGGCGGQAKNGTTHQALGTASFHRAPDKPFRFAKDAKVCKDKGYYCSAAC